MIIKVKVELDRKNPTSVVGKVFTGNHAGKIVFFNNTPKPTVGQVVILEKFDDKGRFLAAQQWTLQGRDEADQKLVAAMESRIKYSRGIDFKKSVLIIIDSMNRRPEYALGMLVENPLRALEKGIKGDANLLTLVRSYQACLGKNTDVISEAMLRLLDGAEKIFISGGGAEQIMELPVFGELYAWTEMLIEHPGTWPTQGIETELGPNGRKFIPLE